jgi:hypothetical protein
MKSFSFVLEAVSNQTMPSVRFIWRGMREDLASPGLGREGKASTEPSTEPSAVDALLGPGREPGFVVDPDSGKQDIPADNKVQDMAMTFVRGTAFWEKPTASSDHLDTTLAALPPLPSLKAQPAFQSNSR